MSEPVEAIIGNPATRWNELFARRTRLQPVPAENRAYWFAWLDKVGKFTVLEYIAGGNLPVEFAIDNDVPKFFFLEWLRERVSPEEMRVALAAYAEIAAVKSAVCLDLTPENPAEAAVLKAVSDRWAWLAERTDPSRWVPPARRIEDKAPPPVNIIMQLGAPTEQPIATAKVIEHTPEALEPEGVSWTS